MRWRGNTFGRRDQAWCLLAVQIGQRGEQTFNPHSGLSFRLCEDERALPLLRREQPFAFQQLNRLPHGNQADVKFQRERGQRRDLRIDRPHAFDDALANRIGDLRAQRTGGIVDILTRAVTEKIASNWGSPIIVEAKPGAGAVIGTEAVASAASDGYTFLVATITGAVGPLINPQFKCDLRRDFVAVGLFATAPNIAVVPPSLAASTMAERVEMARKRPGKLNYAHAGAGSTNHLPVEFLKVSRGLDIVPVAYKGQPQAISDVIGGQIQLFMGASALLVRAAL